MGDKTSIEWTRGDDGAMGSTWNPTRGCSRVSAGCDSCYAMRQARRFDVPGGAYDGLTRIGKRGVDWSGVVRLVPETLDAPLRWKKPRRIFVNSMSDLFHESLSNEDIAAVFGVMAACPQHVFQILTKRAERMREWFALGLHDLFSMMNDGARRATGQDIAVEPTQRHGMVAMRWPLPNVWLGVSAEDQATADARIPHLLATPVAVRFVSYEPALAEVDFSRWTPIDLGYRFFSRSSGIVYRSPPAHLDWIIIGGESGPNARPFDIAWARKTIAACRAVGVACFVKQLGARSIYHVDSPLGRELSAIEVPLRDRKGGDPSEWPADLCVREMPR